MRPSRVHRRRRDADTFVAGMGALVAATGVVGTVAWLHLLWGVPW